MLNPFVEIENRLLSIEDLLLRVLEKDNFNSLPNFPDKLTPVQAVEFAKTNGFILKPSHIYKESMLFAQGKSDFPVLKFGARIVIPRDRFLQWLNNKTTAKVNRAETASIQLSGEIRRKHKKSF